jgi:hypothetical protein
MLGGCAGGQGGPSDSTPVGLGSGSDTEATSGESDTTGAIPNTSSSTTSSSTTSPSTTDDGGSSGTGEKCTPLQWWPDGDSDGFGADDGAVEDCEAPPGYVEVAGDCNDADDAINPDVDELCDGVDNDCNGLLDDYSALNTSCNGCELHEFDGHSYAVCSALQTWDDARTDCMSLFSGDLVKIDDQAESDAILTMVQGSADIRWFIGLSDAVTEGAFVWIDGTALGFDNWDAGEPNDSSGEDCVEVWTVNAWGWNDISCAMLDPYICESPAP